MDQVCDLNRCVVAALAASVRRRESEAELRCLMIASTNYMRTLEQWRDPKSGLNLLQLAVVAGNPHAVRLLYSAYPCLLKTDEDPVLHMACCLGQRDIAQYLVETANCDIFKVATLDCTQLRSNYTRLKGIQQTTLTGKTQVEKETLDIFSHLKINHEFLQTNQETSNDGYEEIERKCVSTDISNPEHQLPSCDHFVAISDQDYSIGMTSKQCQSVTNNASPISIRCKPDGLGCPSNLKSGTPYMFSIDSGNVECANYILDKEFRRSRYNAKPGCVLAMSKWSPLELAAYMGCPRHLAQILQCPHYLHGLSRALQLTLISGNTACLRVLLEAGASLQFSPHRNALHYLCSESLSVRSMLECTKIIVERSDATYLLQQPNENGSTALDYLAWSAARLCTVSRDRVHIPLACKGIITRDDLKEQEKPEYLVLDTMECLLAAGASTLVLNTGGVPDHNILVTVMLSKAANHFQALRICPDLLYRACSLFFKYGADPNVRCHTQHHTAFVTLLLHAAHDLSSDAWKRKYLDLFLLNAAAVDCLVSSPIQRLDNESVHRRWDIYPVMMALEERLPLSLVQVMYNFMAMPHVYQSLHLMRRYHMWQAMTWSLTGDLDHPNYRKQWQGLCRPRVRTLRHCCKMVIFIHTGRVGNRAECLPLPPSLKQYINSTDA